MIGFSATFKGLSPANLIKDTRFGVRKGLHTTANILQNEFRKQVLSKKSGKLYRIKGRLHRASAPYETPANVTGLYRRSVGYLVRGFDELEFGNSAPYAEFLEVGTSRMKPRPGLKNAIKPHRNQIAGIIEREIRKALT